MLLRRLGQTFGRLAGLAFALLGTWVLVINLIERSYSGGTLAWVVGSGLAGAAGGVLFLLSFDGPDRFRNRTIRGAGWVGMLVLAVLPASLSPILLAIMLMTLPLLFVPRGGVVPGTDNGSTSNRPDGVHRGGN